MPRLGLGSVDLSALGGTGQDVVTTIDDFVFESFSASQMHPILTTSRTNLLINSDNGSTYGVFGATKSLNQVTSPAGTLSSFTLEGDGNQNQVFGQSDVLTLPSAGTYTFSVFAKKGTHDFIQLFFNSFSGVLNGDAYFDLENGTTPSSSGRIEDAGNGWFRCSVVGTVVDTDLTGGFAFRVSGSVSSFFFASAGAADGKNAHFHGFQAEQDGFISEYIPTTGSAVTVSTTLNDTSNVWDFDGTDIMIEEDPEDEGFWEESYPDGASLPELVLNGDYEELGSELVTNGDFSLGTASFNEQLGVNFSVTSGVATIQSTGANSLIHQTISPPAVTTILQIEIDVVSFTGSSFNVQFGGNPISVTTTGKQFLLTSSSRSNNKMDIAPQTNETVVIRSISAKQVDPNDRWSLGTGWTISDGKANFDGGSDEAIQQSSVVTNGDTYEVTFTVSGRTTGSLQLRLGNTGVVDTTVTTNTTHTNIFVSDGTSLYFRAVGGFDGSIDNVSVKEYAVQPLDI